MNSSVPGDATTILGAGPLLNGGPLPVSGTAMPQTALLDLFFPGFSVFSGVVYKYLHIDLNLYIPLVLVCTGLAYVWGTVSDYVWTMVRSHLMSIVDVKTDDEIYNMLMHWVADQRFAKKSRRFVANTNLNSRNWYIWRWHDDDDEDGEEDESGSHGRGKKKALAYTPTFGSHWFWYQGRLLIFRRHLKNEQSFLTASEREEISISCFGRDPWILKELLYEARARYMKRDESKTLIYRGTTRNDAGGEPSWQRCMARTTRPFSTVILNEKVKQDLIDDVTDYLNPATRRWYSNRGIPYRRGYLLHGPPGTGKSSLSLALAGFFKMRIYIVSLSSVVSNEENLSSLFAELPRKCVVLLEDIDTAGLTHTREEDKAPADGTAPAAVGTGEAVKVTTRQKLPAPTSGRLSLSGLLNILDGVASQEGRVLIMTTNHVEKLDKALIRPGRVDMVVKFDRADKGMTAAIFRAIYAPLEGDAVPHKARAAEDGSEKGSSSSSSGSGTDAAKVVALTEEQEKEAAEKEAARKAEVVKRVGELAERFAEFIPDREFSPAEIQGFLLKHKRSPEAAVEGAAAWVVEAKVERKEKEARDAEERRQKEEEERKKAEEEKKKKKKDDDEEEDEEEDEKKKKKKERRKKNKSKKSKKKGGKDSDSSESSDESESESESEVEKKKPAKRSKKRKTAEQKAPLVVETKVAETPVTTTAEDQTAAAEDAAEGVSVEAVEEKAIEKTLLVADHKRSGSDSGYGSPMSTEFEAA